MRAEQIADVLDAYRAGLLDRDAAVARFAGFPTSDLGFARLDTQREVRTGVPEVIYCAGKSPEQVRAIVAHQVGRGSSVLATRAQEAHYSAVRDLDPRLEWHPAAGVIALPLLRAAPDDGLYAAVICAGTSDLPVAEEAALTAEVLGARVVRITDVGVAGLHRLFDHLEIIRGAAVIVAVAGMEGALPSVLGGLVSRQIVAVPTSVGYGANFGGLSALLTMLNSCAAGVSVVNIDNGFGAGYLAGTVIRTLRETQR